MMFSCTYATKTTLPTNYIPRNHHRQYLVLDRFSSSNFCENSPLKILNRKSDKQHSNLISDCFQRFQQLRNLTQLELFSLLNEL